MFKYFLILIFIINNLYSQEIDDITGLKKNFLSKIPSNFTADISSPNIKKNLSLIPEEYKVKNKTPYVKINFTKTKINITVINVDEIYKDMFKNYENYFNFNFLNAPESNYIMLGVQMNKNEKVKLVKYIVNNSENYYLIYFNGMDLIERIEYYSDDKLIFTTLINYKMINKFYVPVKFTTLLNDKDNTERQEVFNLSNIVIKS